MDESDSNHSLDPSLFSAQTRKWYSLPSIKLRGVTVVVGGRHVSSLDHWVRDDSLRSTEYLVSLDPPSDFGGFQERVTVVLSTLEMASGPSGFSGGPRENTRKLNLFIETHPQIKSRER